MVLFIISIMVYEPSNAHMESQLIRGKIVAKKGLQLGELHKRGDVGGL